MYIIEKKNNLNDLNVLMKKKIFIMKNTEIKEGADAIKEQIDKRHEAMLDRKEKQEKENLLYMKLFEDNMEFKRQEDLKLRQKKKEMIEEVIIY